MNSDEAELDEILERFDAQTEPFDEVEITDSIQAVAQERGDVHELAKAGPVDAARLRDSWPAWHARLLAAISHEDRWKASIALSGMPLLPS